MKRKIRGLLKKLNASWRRQPALWAIGLVVFTALVNNCVSAIFPCEKDEVFIEMAKRLTGQADESTVAKIKEQAISYLTSKLKLEFATREDLDALINANITLSDLFKSNTVELSQKIDAVERLQDPDLRYRQLLCEVGKETKGEGVPITSDLGWCVMDKMYQILRDDKRLCAPHIAEALLQMALRQAKQPDVIKQAKLREMVNFAIAYLENSPQKVDREWAVYKAMGLLLYDTENFSSFVKREIKENPDFEQQLRNSHFLQDEFFRSQFWPRQK